MPCGGPPSGKRQSAGHFSCRGHKKSALGHGVQARTGDVGQTTSDCFNETKKLTVVLAEIENSIYRLAVAIKKTQKRANALKNIIIPKYEAQVRFISNSLEEKEREEFSRQKVIKSTKIKKEQAQKEKEQAKTE